MTRMSAEVRLQPADRVALDILRDVWRDWRYAADVIAVTFRRNRSLGSEERRRVAEWVYGVVRMHRHVDEVLGAGLRPIGRRLGDFSERQLGALRFMTYLFLFDAAERARAAAE